jgi:chromosome segregation ATPase
MYQVISQIMVYITLAAVIGFIIGWLFFKLRSKENGESIEHILNDELAILKAKNNELEDELIAKSSEYSKIIESNEDLKKRYLTLEMDYEELIKQKTIDNNHDEYIQILENEKFKLTQELDKYKKGLVEQQKFYTLLDGEKDKIKELSHKLQTTTDAFEKQKHDLTNSITKLQSENKFLLDRLNLIEEEKVQLNSKIKKLEISTDEETTEITSLKNKVEISEQELMKIENLERYVAELKEDNLKEKEENKRLNKTINKFKHSQIDTHSINIIKRENEILKSSIETLKKEKAKLTLNIDEVKEKITNKKLKELDNLRDDISKVQEQNKILIEKLSLLQEENISLKQEIEGLLKEEKTEIVKIVEKQKIEEEDNSIMSSIFTEISALKEELKELHKAKEEKNCYSKEHLIDLDDKIHVIDRDKILSFKMNDNYFSRLK